MRSREDVEVSHYAVMTLKLLGSVVGTSNNVYKGVALSGYPVNIHKT